MSIFQYSPIFNLSDRSINQDARNITQIAKWFADSTLAQSLSLSKSFELLAGACGFKSYAALKSQKDFDYLLCEKTISGETNKNDRLFVAVLNDYLSLPINEQHSDYPYYVDASDLLLHVTTTLSQTFNKNQSNVFKSLLLINAMGHKVFPNGNHLNRVDAALLDKYQEFDLVRGLLKYEYSESFNTPWLVPKFHLKTKTNWVDLSADVLVSRASVFKPASFNWAKIAEILDAKTISSIKFESKFLSGLKDYWSPSYTPSKMQYSPPNSSDAHPKSGYGSVKIDDNCNLHIHYIDKNNANSLLALSGVNVTTHIYLNANNAVDVDACVSYASGFDVVVNGVVVNGAAVDEVMRQAADIYVSTLKNNRYGLQSLYAYGGGAFPFAGLDAAAIGSICTLNKGHYPASLCALFGGDAFNVLAFRESMRGIRKKVCFWEHGELPRELSGDKNLANLFNHYQALKQKVIASNGRFEIPEKENNDILYAIMNHPAVIAYCDETVAAHYDRLVVDYADQISSYTHHNQQVNRLTTQFPSDWERFEFDEFLDSSGLTDLEISQWVADLFSGGFKKVVSDFIMKPLNAFYELKQFSVDQLIYLNYYIETLIGVVESVALGLDASNIEYAEQLLSTLNALSPSIAVLISDMSEKEAKRVAGLQAKIAQISPNAGVDASGEQTQEIEALEAKMNDRVTIELPKETLQKNLISASFDKLLDALETQSSRITGLTMILRNEYDIQSLYDDLDISYEVDDLPTIKLDESYINTFMPEYEGD